MNNKVLISIISALFVTGIIALVVSWNDTSVKLALISQRLTTLENEKYRDISQDRQLRSHWKINSWARGQINELRVLHGLSLEDWPDLGATANPRNN